MHIFLDFDGVLHPYGTPALNEDFKLLNNPTLFCWVPLLADILRPYPAVKIIVSADWRRLFDDIALAKLLGVELGARLDGVVETYNSDRANEIRTEAARRNLTRWLAVDDHPSVRAARRKDPRFIWCDPATGLSDPRVQLELARKLAR